MVLVIVALAARAGATPATDLARQYANAITGVEDDEDGEPAEQTAGRAASDEADASDDTENEDADLAIARRTLADHAGELVLDDELASAALTSDELGYASPIAGAVERAEERMRRRRISLLGRFDVAVSWRHRNRAPIHSPAYQAEEIWLLATWRR